MAFESSFDENWLADVISCGAKNRYQIYSNKHMGILFCSSLERCTGWKESNFYQKSKALGNVDIQNVNLRYKTCGIHFFISG